MTPTHPYRGPAPEHAAYWQARYEREHAKHRRATSRVAWLATMELGIPVAFAVAWYAMFAVLAFLAHGALVAERARRDVAEFQLDEMRRVHPPHSPGTPTDADTIRAMALWVASQSAALDRPTFEKRFEELGRQACGDGLHLEIGIVGPTWDKVESYCVGRPLMWSVKEPLP